MKEIKLYKSPWRAIKMILICALFIAAGIWMLTTTNAPAWLAWTAIVFFGLGLPVGFIQLFDRKPQIIINEIGIFDRTTHQDLINWEIIQDAYLTEVHKQKFICLIIDQEYEPSVTGKMNRYTASINKALGFQEINIYLGQIKVDEERLTEFIKSMLAVKQH